MVKHFFIKFPLNFVSFLSVIMIGLALHFGTDYIIGDNFEFFAITRNFELILTSFFLDNGSTDFD